MGCSLSEFETAAEQLLVAGVETLDLIAHSATDDCLLVMGEDLIDPRRREVEARFQRMAEFLRRHITRLRLLGCGTATRPAGRAAILRLSEILTPITVFGTVDGLSARAFGARGLRLDRNVVLLSSDDLR
jgi:hypothetical protein